MAGHNGLTACRSAAHFLDIMDHVHADIADWNDPGLRNILRPLFPVIVSSYSEDGCDRRKAFHNLRFADITGMKNHIDAMKRIDNLWTKQPMSVRHDTDMNHLPSNSPFRSREPIAASTK